MVKQELLPKLKRDSDIKLIGGIILFAVLTALVMIIFMTFLTMGLDLFFDFSISFQITEFITLAIIGLFAHLMLMDV